LAAEFTDMLDAMAVSEWASWTVWVCQDANDWVSPVSSD
jgi:hypothetical protein